MKVEENNNENDDVDERMRFKVQVQTVIYVHYIILVVLSHQPGTKFKSEPLMSFLIVFCR